jgi:hypothetical protein
LGNVIEGRSWPGPVCHLNQIVPAGTAGLLRKLPLRTSCFNSVSEDNRCIAATGHSVFLHTTGRWVPVLGNQLLHKTDQFQGAADAWFPTSECK